MTEEWGRGGRLLSLNEIPGTVSERTQKPHTNESHRKKKKTLSLLPRNTHAVFDTPTVSFQNYANPQAQQHDFVGGFVCLFVFLSLALTNAVLSKPDTHWQTVSLTPC